MHVMALMYPESISQHALDQLSWGHIIVLTRIKDSVKMHYQFHFLISVFLKTNCIKIGD